MKTKIYSAVNRSVKGIIALTLLSTMLCTFGVKANGAIIVNQSGPAKDKPLVGVIVNQVIPGGYLRPDANSSELKDQETQQLILQWISESLFWDKADSLTIEVDKTIIEKRNEEDSLDLEGSFNRIKAFILFKAKQFISDSEF